MIIEAEHNAAATAGEALGGACTAGGAACKTAAVMDFIGRIMDIQ